jgi:putative ABC transport system permease protein
MWLEGLGQDIRYAVRSLWKNKGYALAACGTLALGLGATIAVYSVVDAVLLRPLAYPDAHELYAVYSSHPARGDLPPSYPDFVDLDGEVQSADLAFSTGLVFALRSDRGMQRVLGAAVSPGFFRVLGTQPLLGRSFTEEDDQLGNAVVVLSYGFWTTQLGRDVDVLGQTLGLDGREHLILGVMPKGVEFPYWADVWVPLGSVAASIQGLGDRGRRVDTALLARIDESSGPRVVEAEFRGLAGRLAAGFPGSNADFTISMVPLRDQVIGDSGRQLGLLALAVSFVMLLACANVANLTLARNIARRDQFAVRLALGGSWLRITRQLVVESALVTVAAGVLGFTLAAWGVELFRAWGGANLPRLEGLSVDGRMVMLAGLVSALALLLSGVAPALNAARHSPAQVLRSGSVGARNALSRHVRSGLVLSEVALAVTLLLGLGLLMRSLMNVRSVDMGFDVERLVTVRIFPPAPRYDDADAARALYAALQEAVSAIPGVESVGLINHMPSVGGRIATRVVVPGRVEAPGEQITAGYRVVSPSYLEAAGLSVVEGDVGRFIRGAPGQIPILINQRLAALLWPNASALKRPITVFRQSPDRPDRGEPIVGEVVAVVGNVRANGPERDVRPEVYVRFREEVWGNAYLVVRARDEAAGILGAVREAVLKVDPDIPVARVTKVSDAIAGWRVRRTQVIGLLFVFSLVGILLATAGVYAVMSFLVRERHRELGIRMALGATPGSVLRLLLQWALALGLGGVGLGLIMGLGVVRLIRSELFGVAPTDPTVLGGVTVVLLAVVLFASYLPAARAASHDPSSALRDT